jgi:hypothetical protein
MVQILQIAPQLIKFLCISLMGLDEAQGVIVMLLRQVFTCKHTKIGIKREQNFFLRFAEDRLCKAFGLSNILSLQWGFQSDPVVLYEGV